MSMPARFINACIVNTDYYYTTTTTTTTTSV